MRDDITASDTPSDLVELREAEDIGALDDERVRLRDVEARLDDRCRDEHVRVARMKASMRSSSSRSGSWPCATRKRNSGQSCAASGALLDRLDPVVEVERLSTPLGLALEGVLDELLVVFADVSPYRSATLRRCLDDADIT